MPKTQGIFPIYKDAFLLRYFYVGMVKSPKPPKTAFYDEFIAKCGQHKRSLLATKQQAQNTVKVLLYISAAPRRN